MDTSQLATTYKGIMYPAMPCRSCVVQMYNGSYKPCMANFSTRLQSSCELHHQIKHLRMKTNNHQIKQLGVVTAVTSNKVAS